MLIVGGGLSGVGAACHLQRERPEQSFLIVEARGAIGGTWDLFRYPGIRSDSDMFTLGYSFKPWEQSQAIADGPSIRAYISEAVAENSLAERIRLHTKVSRADWSSETSQLERGARRAGRHRQHRDLLVPLRLHGLLPLRRAVHARIRGHRALRRHGRSPPALAGGPRLRGQARRRDRQRRDRRHARSGDGGQGRARDHAPALAQLRAVAARERPAGRPRAAMALGTSRLRLRALEERSPRPGGVRPVSQAARVRQAGAAALDQAAAPRRLRRRHPFQPELRPMGPAHVPGARGRPVRGDLLGRCVGRDERDRLLHRDRAAAGRRAPPGRGHRDHGDGAEPARVRRHRARGRRA